MSWSLLALQLKVSQLWICKFAAQSFSLASTPYLLLTITVCVVWKWKYKCAKPLALSRKRPKFKGHRWTLMCFKQYFFSHWQLVLTTKVHLDDLRSASSGAMIWSVVYILPCNTVCRCIIKWFRVWLSISGTGRIVRLRLIVACLVRVTLITIIRQGAPVSFKNWFFVTNRIRANYERFAVTFMFRKPLCYQNAVVLFFLMFMKDIAENGCLLCSKRLLFSSITLDPCVFCLRLS